MKTGIIQIDNWIGRMQKEKKKKSTIYNALSQGKKNELLLRLNRHEQSHNHRFLSITGLVLFMKYYFFFMAFLIILLSINTEQSLSFLKIFIPLISSLVRICVIAVVIYFIMDVVEEYFKVYEMRKILKEFGFPVKKSKWI